MRPRAAFAAAASAIALAAAACGPADAPAPERTVRADSAGIPSFDLSGETPATVVPSEYEGGFLGGVGDVLVNDLGIWVADVRNVEVLWFDGNGNLKTRFGRQGSGPGELTSVAILGVDSLLAVDDARQGRQVRFRLDGSHKETITVRRFPHPIFRDRPLERAVTLRGGFTVGAIDAVFGLSANRRDEEAIDFLHRVVLLDPDGQAADTLFSYHWGLAALKTNRVASVHSPPFGASGAWAVLGDSAVALADGAAGTLTFVAPEAGEIRTTTVDLGLEVRAVTDRDLARVEDAFRERQELPRERQIDVPDVWSVAADLVPDGDQVFWLRQGVEGDNEEWMVCDLAARSKSRVVLPERFRLKAVRGGLLYGVRLDELDVPSVGTLPNPVAAGGGPGSACGAAP